MTDDCFITPARARARNSGEMVAEGDCRRMVLKFIKAATGIDPIAFGWIPYGNAEREQAFNKDPFNFTVRPATKTVEGAREFHEPFSIVLWRADPFRNAIVQLLPEKMNAIVENSQYGRVKVSAQELSRIFRKLA